MTFRVDPWRINELIFGLRSQEEDNKQMKDEIRRQELQVKTVRTEIYSGKDSDMKVLEEGKRESVEE